MEVGVPIGYGERANKPGGDEPPPGAAVSEAP